MSATVRWTGLQELKAALRELPHALTDEASGYVLTAATDTVRDVRAGFAEGPTGNLRRGVGLGRTDRSAFGVKAVARSMARHTWMYNNGTQNRRTRKGWNRGRSPEHRIFVATAVDNRRRMYQSLRVMLERAGLVVRS